MPLEPDQMLSHYRLVEKIGEGGMGVVWKAEDTKLGREVALKFLTEEFSADPERLARFQREAKLLASLNHANIATIHGLEEAGGERFLVLEFVPGDNLAVRLTHGPLPVAETVTICRQITEALDAAHESGVFHRDLKPANISLTPEGSVKVLDFGLAKAWEPESASADASQSPTSREIRGDPRNPRPHDFVCRTRPMTSQAKRSSELRAAIRAATLRDEAEAVAGLVETAALDAATRVAISKDASDLVRTVRNAGAVGLMQSFLGEYGLSTKEGVALMCLAEALLRVPDAETIDALISDKIAAADWGRHLGHSSSSLVNASTWALLLTGRVLKEEGAEDLAEIMRGALRRLGEPVIRTATARAMKEMGRQFVLGRTIGEAAARARDMEAKGYAYSYDMLGEAARTEADARRYHLSYSHAISALAERCGGGDIRANPGISVKLSALHARYEESQRDRVMAELVPRARSLALLAKSAGMGFNIDAEEADRLDLSLDAIEVMLADPPCGLSSLKSPT